MLNSNKMNNTMRVLVVTFSLAAGIVTARIGSGEEGKKTRSRSALEDGSCYIKQWDGWTNEDGLWTTQNYCELKTNCADWELNAGGTWEECCANHCQNTGLTKNKPGQPSPTPGTTEPPTLQPVPLPTERPSSSPSIQFVASPTAQPVPSLTTPPVSSPGDGCWKKSWSWPNDSCFFKPIHECQPWEIAEATSWEQCCASHCTGTGLTKPDGSTASPVTSPVASPVASPSASPVASPIAEPNGKCTATGETCTFEPGAGISAWFTQELFDEMFPNLCAAGCEDACQMLTYPCLIQATLDYPAFANSGNRDDDMRELAAWLGIMGQETTGGGCQPPGMQNADGTCSCSAPSWCDSHPNGGCSRWGLCKVLEAGGTYCSPSALYPCVNGKSYRGRGPKQLSYNYNYGQFSKEYCGDQNILLQNPDWVATNPTLAWASSIWFWFTGGACDRAGGERCKPSPHNVFTGKHEMCPSDVAANRQYGLGWATNVVNGGLECGSGTSAGKCDYRVYSRVRFYRHYCSILGVEPLADGWTDDNLFCGSAMNYAQRPPQEC